MNIPVIIICSILLAAGIAAAILYRRRKTIRFPASDSDDDIPDTPLPESVNPDVAAADQTRQITEDACGFHVSIRDDYPIVDEINPVTREHIIDITQTLPKLPAATINLLPVLSQPGAGAEQVAAIIRHDQTSAARLLRWVNSSFYGLEGKVESLKRAVIILGFDAVRTLVLEDSLSRHATMKGFPNLSPEDIWRHAAAVSIIAKNLASRARGVEPELAATAGLLHEIGMLLLLAVERENLGKVLELSESDKSPLISREYEVYGFNHQIWGEILIAVWNLPIEIARAVGIHHTPMKDPSNKLAAILWLADYLASRIGFECPKGHVPHASNGEIDELMRSVGLKPPLDSYLTSGIYRDIKNATRFWEKEKAASSEAAV